MIDFYRYLFVITNAMTYAQYLIHNPTKIVVFQRNIGAPTIYCKKGLSLTLFNSMTTIAINNRPYDTLGFIYEMTLRDEKQLSVTLESKPQHNNKIDLYHLCWEIH